MVSIYTTHMQPATGWIDQCGEVEIRGGFDAGEMIRRGCCDKKRPAEDCVVQCYYDGMSVWCAEGKGCKSHAEIEQKRLIAHGNRSRGQMARRAKERLLLAAVVPLE